MRIAFEEFTLDPEAQELRRDGKVVPLRTKAMRLLELLVERRGKVITRGELIERIWPDVTVSEASLKNLVSTLRRALEDHERSGRFIQSVHQRGYRFVGAVTLLDEQRDVPRAVLRYEGRRIPLYDGVVVVGRSRDCAISLNDPSVSRHHARLTIAADQVTLEDLGSRNGLFLEGVRTTGPQLLTGEHEIHFGRAVAYLTLCLPAPTTRATESMA